MAHIIFYNNQWWKCFQKELVVIFRHSVIKNHICFPNKTYSKLLNLQITKTTYKLSYNIELYSIELYIKEKYGIELYTIET